MEIDNIHRKLLPKYIGHFSLAKISVLVLSAAFLLFLLLPLNPSLLNDPYSTLIEDKNGVLLSAQIAKDGQWRFPMMEDLPTHFIACITTYEDKRFYSHFGIDPIAIVRAIKQNVKARKIVSGGSTLSMQIMRMSRKGNSRNLAQKLIEAFLAIKLEFKYSKEGILRIYAAHAPFGGNVVGLEAASWRYYQKRPSELSWAQMATLCVLPNAPSLVRMDKNADRLLKKRNFLLRKLYKKEIIDKLDLELALSETLNYGLYSLPHHAPHLLARAKKDGNTSRTKTTIDATVQKRVNDLLDYHYESFAVKGIHNAAVVILDTRTQKIVTYAGNVPSTTEEKDVDMIKAHRSSGSILKPFLYAAMIEEGAITPQSFVKDVPVFIDGFSPRNYHESYTGVLPANKALSQSLNIPFVLMLQQYGVDKFRRKLNDIGLNTVNKSGGHYGLSLILGGAEVRLDELTTAYAHMGRQLFEYDRNKGKYSLEGFSGLKYVEKRSEGKGAKTRGQGVYQSFSASSIHHTFTAMKNVLRPNGFGDWEMFASSKRIAWKTGTSYGHRDAWAIGTHPQYTVGVWVGNADGEGIDEIIGVSTAGKILFDVLDILPLDDSWWAIPYDDMDEIEVCSTSGMLPSVYCQNKESQWMSKSSNRSPVCQYHQSIWTDETGEYTVNRTCYPMEKAIKSSILKLSPLVSKYYSRLHYSAAAMPFLHPECNNGNGNNEQLELIYPNPDERIFIPRDLNAARQEVIAQLEHTDPKAEVFWHLNGNYLGVTRNFHTMSLDGRAGGYALLCTDQYGNTIERKFKIVGE